MTLLCVVPYNVGGHNHVVRIFVNNKEYIVTDDDRTIKTFSLDLKFIEVENYAYDYINDHNFLVSIG